MHPSQMDFEYATATVAYLLASPSKVSKLTQWHHEIKGRWSRDDPAFVVILCAFIAVDFVAYGLALSATGLLDVLRHIVFGLLCFILSGAGAASTTQTIANVYFPVRHPHSATQRVEWLYAFDVHCNASFPAFVLLGVVQFLLLPVLVSTSMVATVLSNSLFLAACVVYFYNTFLGFVHLPFLNRDKVAMLLSPCLPLSVVWLVCTILNVNATRFCLGVIF